MIMNTSATDSPSDRLDREGLPPDAVLLVPPAPPSASSPPQPLRVPAGAWGLVVVAARLTEAMGDPLLRLAGLVSLPDTTFEDTIELLAGVWIFEQPPADLHGDVVLRFHTTLDADTFATEAEAGIDAGVDVEVLTATEGEWRSRLIYVGMSSRWPHKIALTVVQLMRDGAHRDEGNAFLSTLTSLAGTPDPAPDALADLVEAGLLSVGEQVRWGSRVATVGERCLYAGTVVPTVDLHGDIAALSTLTDLSAVMTGATVNVLAARHARYAVNGWHLWRLTREGDDRVLDTLRTELAAHR